MTTEWIITFPGTDMTLRGTGPLPVVVQAPGSGTGSGTDTGSSTGSQSGPGPADVEPPDDNTPFTWPAQPSPPSVDPPDKRNYALTMNDASPMRWFYATPPNDPNPSPGSHLFAGLLPQGMHVKYGNPPRLVEGLRLWVPRDAQPSLIRRALAGRIA